MFINVDNIKAKELIDNLKDKHINNLNININIQQIQANEKSNTLTLYKLHNNHNQPNKRYEDDENVDLIDEDYYTQSPGKKSLFSNYPESPNSLSKRWRILSNVVKSVSSFRRCDTKKLENVEALDQDLNDFKEKYNMSIDKKRRYRDSIGTNQKSNIIRLSTMNNIFYSEVLKDNLKEAIVAVILE